jgi:threonylcarbamoyladenosine tRNA methylthiotransferase MtaB
MRGEERAAGVDVQTFGCRLNACESDILRDEAARAGLRDTVVFNTCAVTGEAVAQARQAIRKARRARPDARIVVTGCAAQIHGAAFAAMPEVDRVIGNAEKLRGETWRRLGDAPRLDVGDIFAARTMTAARHAAARTPRAFVQVQSGCDHRCTFCIIPFGRGASRSLPMADVARAVRAHLDAGCAEIVLTGVDLTSYGADLPDAPTLGLLVKHILRDAPDCARLRISSIDAAEADRDLLDVIAADARLMPHLHLSLQSGDDLILKRMKRRHSRRDAVAFCAQLRRLRPDIALGADLIAGFPTETEAMAARTRDLVEACGLTFLHVFPFSARQGTPAARMPQVEPALARSRAQRLREAGAAALARRLRQEVGRTRSVLAESATQGRTEHFLPVRIAPSEPGAVRDLPISGEDGVRLLAGPAA